LPLAIYTEEHKAIALEEVRAVNLTRLQKTITANLDRYKKHIINLRIVRKSLLFSTLGFLVFMILSLLMVVIFGGLR
jgi:hypothetical protein